MKNKVLLIGLHDGKTFSGVYYAFRLLVSELAKRNLPFWIVNLGSMQEMHRVGSFSFGRSFEIIQAILKTWIYLPFCSLVYLTIAISLLGFFRDMLILLPAFLLRKKTVIHVHSGGYGDFYKQQHPIIQKLIKFTISRVDTIIILSYLLKGQFEFLGDDSKFVVVHITVDQSLLNSEPSAKQLDPGLPVLLLYLSNMMVDKGYLELLEACRILKDRGKVKYICNFCGDFIQTASDIEQKDSEVDQLKDLFLTRIKQYQLEDIVRYLGPIKGELKKEILQKSHLFILPTRYPWEGQPVSIMEAMAYGIPVISTNFRAIPDQIVVHVTGYLLKSIDPSEIADRVEYLWHNPQKYQEMSRQSIEKFFNEFTTERHMQKMVNVLYGN